MTPLTNKTLFYLFLTVIILAPLPLGSNREWSWTLCALLIGAISLLWAITQLFDKHHNRTPLNPWLITGFLAVLAWAILQTSQLLPPAWTHPLWQMAHEILHGDPSAALGTVSLAPDDTWTATLRLLCYGLVFFLAFQWGRDEHRAHRTLQWMVFAGVLYAIYGLGNFWSGSEMLFWFEDPAYKGDVRGTFVNRNHYATYAGLGLLCALALFYRNVALQPGNAAPLPAGMRIPEGARVTTTTDRLERFALQVWRPLLVILLLTTALILTHSRGGFLATLAGGAALFLALNHRRPVRSKGSLAVIAVATGMAAIAFWLTSEVLLKRIDSTKFDDNLRLVAYEVIGESTRENPLLGFGYGTFADSFRLYRTDSINAYLDRAHNTYLENAFELGWPAALLLFGLVAGCAVICLRGLNNRGKDWIYPALGIAASVLAAIHAWFDFSFQMPAVAMTYATIMGVACAQSYSSRIT